MQQSSEEKNDIFCSVFTELKALGVKVPKIKKFKSSISKQARPFSSLSTSSDKIFGAYLSEQEKINVADYILPKFIVVSTSYLKNFTKKEGLFRKAGSISRQRDLRAKLERGESIEDSDPNDVAALLKKWLRELPEPLIPFYLQDLFVRCLNLHSKENIINAVLLCCHLLPVDHLQTLKHLLHFLSDIANNSDHNKMDPSNLALIMAPNVFVMGKNSIDKSSNNLLQQHTCVIELLIKNADRVELSACSSLHLAETEALKNSDLELSIDVLDYSPPKSKKKRKSGPVQDLFTGFKKLVGQNSVSPNPAKRSNQDDCKSTESRFASKRKADPDLLSTSPFKKPNISHSENSHHTPNNKNTQSIFGTKEKTGSAHSRRKSFGLLRRKEKKRQKSAKSSTPAETKLSIGTPSTPYVLQENLNVSFKESSKDPTCFDKSLPILSPIDVESVFSKTILAKKSLSDCYLNLPQEKFTSQFTFSNSSSEGCLSAQENKSPYFLRFNITRNSVKRKSDTPKNKPETSIKQDDDKEDSGTSCSPWFNRKSSKNNNSSKKQHLKLEILSPEHVNALPNNITDNFSEKSGCIMSSVSDKTNTPNATKASFHRRSSRKPKNSEFIMKEGKVKKPIGDKDPARSDAVNDSVPIVISTESGVTAAPGSSLQNNDLVRRKCSISRQDAFIIKPKNPRRNTLGHLKRADSIKISKSKISRISHQKNGLSSEKMEGKSATNNSNEAVSEKKNENLVSDKKHTRRNVRNGSIVRGRPNTVKTGLPSGACSRYNSESFSVNNHRNLASTSSVDNDLFINVANQSTNQSEEDLDLSITLQIQNITLSSPNEEKIATNINIKNSIPKCTLETTISIDAAETTINNVKEIGKVSDVRGKKTMGKVNEVNAVKVNTDSTTVRKAASRRKSRDRLCSNSDSKINKMKKRSKVSRIHSFPEPTKKLRRRSTKKLRSVKSSSPPKSLGNENISLVKVEKENKVFESSSDKSNPNDQKTPENNNAEQSQTWVSGRQFLENEELTQEEVFNKRESIAMILRNNPGHVKAKASLYNYRSQDSTPRMLRSFATPNARLYDPQYSDMQGKVSRRSASVRSNKSVRKNYSVPPPPKFVIPDSPIPSFPLKELTNISNSEDKTDSPSPLKKTNTSNKEKLSVHNLNQKCTLKPKRNSYSGHTPYKLPVDRNKVFRSESSPLLRKVSKKSLESLSPIKDASLPSLIVNSCSSPVLKTRSSLGIEKV